MLSRLNCQSWVELKQPVPSKLLTSGEQGRTGLPGLQSSRIPRAAHNAVNLRLKVYRQVICQRPAARFGRASLSNAQHSFNVLRRERSVEDEEDTQAGVRRGLTSK